MLVLERRHRLALRLTSDLNSAIVRVIGGRVGTSASWFARAAAALRLVGGSYYFSHPAAAAGGPVFVGILAVEVLLDGSRSPPRAAVAAVTDRAIRDGLEGTAPGPVFAGSGPAPERAAAHPAGVQIASNFAGSEPWDEAFDFGRSIPVAEREVGGVLQPTVIARDVYDFIGPGRNFPTWFAAECERRTLKDRVDYEMFNFPRSGEIKRKGPCLRRLCAETDAAKAIGMSCEGSRLKSIRLYFLERERRF